MIAENLIQVNKTINDLLAVNRHPTQKAGVQLVAVTKNHPVEAMQEAIDNGVTVIGENRVQEARQKAKTLERSVQWHLIGHLQTNKVKPAVELFDLIHSVDSEKVAREINRIAEAQNKVQNILLQINLAREKNKFGVLYEDINLMIITISLLKNLNLCGLMMIAPHFSDPEQARPLFRVMYNIFVDLYARQLVFPDFKILSMGMSNDYKIAVEEGANMVRIGTGIFGERQY